MTVAQIKKMIEGMSDNAKVKFVGEYEDRDRCKSDCFVEVKAIASSKCKIVTIKGREVAVDFR